MSIETFVFLDINTVGYSVKEKKGAKITELTLMAVSRKDIITAESGTLPPFGKLSLLINPQKDIPSQIAKSSGLSNVYLTNQPIFRDKVNTINSFLELPKPVCLVACKGNRFDYKILRSEYVEANAQLPDDLLCVDPISLLTEEIKSKVKETTAPSSANNSLLDTQSLNASGVQPASPSAPSNENQPGPSNVDDLNDAFAGMTTNTTPKKERYTVQKIYKSVINREPSRSQRTDVTAMMLLECVIAIKHVFLPWADQNRRLINNIEPF
ncbi:three-prime repair exonuclease 1-like [Danaus plexippus]|uniref:three-prime repair exonuclease 1-like n=1 Tax=Danaus plexippus TaxID=13037 RepID=UPI002AB2849A|nr:three-prime repair exonuclease 1-like [Danaus plexippus]